MKHSSKPVLTLSQLIQRRRSAALDGEDTVTLLIRIGVLVLAAYLLLTQAFLITQLSGSDMFPALKDGDLLIGFRLQKEYAKGDVVIFDLDGQRYVGRIIARETDVVTLSDSGQLQVNGTTQSGEIIYPTYAKEGIVYPYRVPEGHFFILGDYRTQAKDSRDFGPVPLESMEAKLITILRRRGI